MNLAQHAIIGSVRVYRWALSPALQVLFGPGAGCRYDPTCSVYAIHAVKIHGAIGGCWLALKRLARCHPWGSCGHDPVPPRFTGEDVCEGHGDFLMPKHHGIAAIKTS